MRMTKIKLQIHNTISQFTELDGTIVAINNDTINACVIQVDVT